MLLFGHLKCLGKASPSTPSQTASTSSFSNTQAYFCQSCLLGEVLSPLQQTMKRRDCLSSVRHVWQSDLAKLLELLDRLNVGYIETLTIHSDGQGLAAHVESLLKNLIFTIFSSFSLSESKHTAYSIQCMSSIYIQPNKAPHVVTCSQYMCKFRTDAFPVLGRGLTENLLHWISYFLLRGSKMI